MGFLIPGSQVQFLPGAPNKRGDSMAGHSKWANIKHKKAASDAVKGKLFSKLAKEIVVAARSGGGDPSANITLRSFIQKARAANMPSDNIERAIKKGTGELGGAAMEEIIYEGFAPGGVSLIVQALTDNRNRTAPEVRHVFTKHNGNLATQGSVMRTFRRKGYILVSSALTNEDKLLEVVLDVGAEDVQQQGDVFEILTEPTQLAVVCDALTMAGIKIENSEITLFPDIEIPIKDKEQAAHILKFIEDLEDLDDVQNVYANCDIDETILEAGSKG